MVVGKQGALTQLIITLLALWSIATAGLMAGFGVREAVLFGLALAGGVVAVSLARPFRGAFIAAMVLGVLGIFGMQLYRSLGIGAQFDLRLLITPLPAALALAVAALLGEAAARRIVTIEQQLSRDAVIIEELTRDDDFTGALKEVYGERLLAQELVRARRYKRPLSIALLAPDDWPSVEREHGEEQARETLKTAAVVLKERLREVDSFARRQESQFLAVLPETSGDGAQTVAERLCQALTSRTALQFRCGIAEFPSDAASKEELLAEAEAAMRFARTGGVLVAGHSLLS